MAGKNQNILCLCDTKGIQDFLFAKPTAQDIAAADYVLHNEFYNALAFAINRMSEDLKPDEYIIDYTNSESDKLEFFHTDKIKLQLISYVAGNAHLLFKNKELFEKFSKLIQIYFSRLGSILSMVIVGVEMTNDLSYDNKCLYQKLEEIKAKMPSSASVCTLPIMKIEKYTGLPAVKYDEKYKDWISEDTYNNRKYLKYLLKHNTEDLFKKNKTLAYVHIDGNNLGMKIAKYKGKIKDPETCMLANRIIDEKINTIYGGSYRKSIDWFVEKLEKDGIPKDDLHLYFREINSGGDDINFIINSRYALKFVVHLMRTISKCETNLVDDDKSIRNSTCAGIAFVNSYTSFGQACELSVQCCDNAKERAKLDCNLIDGQVGNWFDFQIFFDDNINEVEYLRRHSKSMDGYYNLMLRPYCLDDELSSHPCHYKNYEENLKKVLSEKYLKTRREKLLEAIKQGRYEFAIMNRINMLNGNIKTNFYDGSIVKIPGDDNYYNSLFDVLELGELYE